MSKHSFSIIRLGSFNLAEARKSDVDKYFNHTGFRETLCKINPAYHDVIKSKDHFHELTLKEKKTFAKYWFRLIGKNSPMNNTASVALVNPSVAYESLDSNVEKTLHRQNSIQKTHKLYQNAITTDKNYESTTFRQNILNKKLSYHLEIFLEKNKIEKDTNVIKNLELYRSDTPFEIENLIKDFNLKELASKNIKQFILFLLKEEIIIKNDYPSLLSKESSIFCQSGETSYYYHAKDFNIPSDVINQIEEVSNILIQCFSSMAGNNSIAKKKSAIADLLYQKIESSYIDLAELENFIELRNYKLDNLLLDDSVFLRWLTTRPVINNSINLNEEDFKDIENIIKLNYNENFNPPGFSAVYSITENDQILFSHLSGFPGTQMVARYNTGLEKLKIKLNEYQGKIQETNQDIIYAELDTYLHSSTSEVCVHLPSTEYVISLQSGISNIDVKIIPIEDLEICSDGSKLYLRSKTLKKQIIPFENNPRSHQSLTNPMYYLLKYFSYQFYWPNIHPFFLGPHLLEYFPALRYKNIILFPRTWSFRKSETTFLSIKEKIKGINEIVLHDFGNNFYINLNSMLGLNILEDMWNKNPTNIPFIIKEFIAPSNSIPFSNMIISNFIGKEFNQLNIPTSSTLRLSENDWIYCKIYSDEFTLLKLLRSEIFSFITRLNIQTWFYLFFKDKKGLHLRLRINTSQFNKNEINQEKNLFFHEINHKRYGIVEISPYHMEDSVYGGKNGVEYFEKISCMDSTIAIALHRRVTSYDEKISIFLIIAAFYFKYSSHGHLLLKQLSTEEKKSLLRFKNISNTIKDRFSTLKNHLKNSDLTSYKTSLGNILITNARVDLLNSIKLKVDNKLIEQSIDILVLRYIHLLHNRIFIGHGKNHEVLLTKLALKLSLTIKRNDESRASLKNL